MRRLPEGKVIGFCFDLVGMFAQVYQRNWQTYTQKNKQTNGIVSIEEMKCVYVKMKSS